MRGVLYHQNRTSKHIHTVDINCLLVALQRWLLGKTPRMSLHLWQHKASWHLHFFYSLFSKLLTCTRLFRCICFSVFNIKVFMCITYNFSSYSPISQPPCINPALSRLLSNVGHVNSSLNVEVDQMFYNSLEQDLPIHVDVTNFTQGLYYKIYPIYSRFVQIYIKHGLF